MEIYSLVYMYTWMVPNGVMFDVLTLMTYCEPLGLKFVDLQIPYSSWWMILYKIILRIKCFQYNAKTGKT